MSPKTLSHGILTESGVSPVQSQSLFWIIDIPPWAEKLAKAGLVQKADGWFAPAPSWQ